MLPKALRAAGVLTAAVLFERLAGAVPFLGVLAGLIIIVLLAAAATGSQSASDRGAVLRWRELLRHYRFSLGLAALMVLAIVVRLPHIGGDLGHSAIDIDENRLAANVQHFFLTGEIGHLTVEHYPGVVFWMVAGSSLLAYLWALMHGAIRDLSQMPVATFVAAGRLTDAFIGLATVAYTGLLGRELSGDATGLLAAGLVAIVPLSVDTTTLLRNDPGQALFLTVAAYAALVAYRSDGRGSAAVAGALAGVATGIKYTSVFVLVPALLASSLRGSPTRRFDRVCLTVLGFVVAVAATNHFIWSDFPNFLKQLSDQVAVWGPPRWSAENDPATFRTFMLNVYGPGLAMLLLGAAYGAYGLGTGRPKAWVFWSFPLLYGWLTMQRPTIFPRWIYPLVPFASVAGAAGLVSLVAAIGAWRGWVGHRVPRLLRTATIALVPVIALAQPLWGGTVSFSRRLRTPTYQIVETWLEEHASGSTVLAQDGELDFKGTMVHVHRVPSLREALNGGLYSLYANDWVVVPEFDKGHPALRQLLFVKDVVAGEGLRGNTGLDYEIYATPKLPRSGKGDDVRLGEAPAAPMLGPEWKAKDTDRAEAGLALPEAGASLFLPPFIRENARIEIELVGVAPGWNVLPLHVSAGGMPVAMAVVASEKDGRLRLAGVAQLPDPARVTELRLQANAPGGRIRVARFRFD